MSICLINPFILVPPQPAFISTANATNTTGTTISCNIPTDVSSGDFLIAIMSCSTLTNYTWTGDTDWTEIADEGATPSFRLAYKIATASEPASYTFTTNASADKSVVICAFRNVTYGQIGTFGTVVQSPPVSVTAPSITLASGSKLHMVAFGTSGALTTYTTPSGFTDGGFVFGSGSGSVLFYKLNPTSGATGSISSTMNVSTGSGNRFVGIQLGCT